MMGLKFIEASLLRTESKTLFFKNDVTPIYTLATPSPQLLLSPVVYIFSSR